jgi:hypothetical protein
VNLGKRSPVYTIESKLEIEGGVNFEGFFVDELTMEEGAGGGGDGGLGAGVYFVWGTWGIYRKQSAVVG